MKGTVTSASRPFLGISLTGSLKCSSTGWTKGRMQPAILGAQPDRVMGGFWIADLLFEDLDDCIGHIIAEFAARS